MAGALGELIPLDVPSDVGFAVHRGRLFVTPCADWESEGRTFPAGSLLAIGVDRAVGFSVDGIFVMTITIILADLVSLEAAILGGLVMPVIYSALVLVMTIALLALVCRRARRAPPRR